MFLLNDLPEMNVTYEKASLLYKRIQKELPEEHLLYLILFDSKESTFGNLVSLISKLDENLY